ncbi:MAG: global cell cycle regulator GcrA-like protein [Alphaproteobacteria bacterium]|nr:global cell cycle regulator GcrA-like protein [Alphaproteobacteria bacterium]
MSWTEQRVNDLQRLWSEGLSASQIARRLGGTTRNAVIGKVHRLGLASRQPQPTWDASQAMRLTEHMCRWPIGHPGEASFRFCCKKADPGRPYCEEHCAMAYRPKDNAAA